MTCIKGWKIIVHIVDAVEKEKVKNKTKTTSLVHLMWYFFLSPLSSFHWFSVYISNWGGKPSLLARKKDYPLFHNEQNVLFNLI